MRFRGPDRMEGRCDFDMVDLNVTLRDGTVHETNVFRGTWHLAHFRNIANRVARVDLTQRDIPFIDSRMLWIRSDLSIFKTESEKSPPLVAGLPPIFQFQAGDFFACIRCPRCTDSHTHRTPIRNTIPQFNHQPLPAWQHSNVIERSGKGRSLLARCKRVLCTIVGPSSSSGLSCLQVSVIGSPMGLLEGIPQPFQFAFKFCRFILELFPRFLKLLLLLWPLGRSRFSHGNAPVKNRRLFSYGQRPHQCLAGAIAIRFQLHASHMQQV